MKKDPKKTVSVRMPPDLYETLKQLAQEECRSVPSCIRLILQEHLGQR